MSAKKERTIAELKKLKEEYSLLLDTVEAELSKKSNDEFFDSWNFVIENGKAVFEDLDKKTISTLKADVKKLVKQLFGSSFKIVDSGN